MAVSPSQRVISLGLIPEGWGSGSVGDVILFSGDGAPSGGTIPQNGQTMTSDQTAIYIRRDASTLATLLYGTINGGTAWTAFDPTDLSGLDLDGSELVLDADGDTSITADTDDQIDIRISGADDFTFTANSFNVLTGSAIDLADSCQVKFGTGDDIAITWDGSKLAVTQAAANSSISWGVDNAGIDHIFYGDTAGSKMTWDQSADSLLFTDSTPITFGDGSDVTLQFDATNLVVAPAVADTGAFVFGADDAGMDVIFYGDTSGSNITWDQSADSLKITDSTPLVFGDGGDVLVQFDATNLKISTAVADTGAVALGASGAGVDLILYGDTATYDVTWDQSADSLIFADNAKLAIGTGSDSVISYDGTDLLWAHASGELTIDNQDATGSTIVMLGADTTAVDFQVQGDGGTAGLTVFGSGLMLGGVTSVNMANAAHALKLTGAGAGETDLSGNVVFVDPAGGSQTLTLPAEADSAGMVLYIFNAADAAEAVTVANDAAGTVIVLDQSQSGLVACDGTTWRGFMGATT